MAGREEQRSRFHDNVLWAHKRLFGCNLWRLHGTHVFHARGLQLFTPCSTQWRHASTFAFFWRWHRSHRHPHAVADDAARSVWAAILPRQSLWLGSSSAQIALVSPPAFVSSPALNSALFISPQDDDISRARASLRMCSRNQSLRLLDMLFIAVRDTVSKLDDPQGLLGDAAQD